MYIAAKYTGETFSLMGDDRAECFEGVEFFKYLGRFLHQSDKYWPEVFRNIGREIQFWGRLGKFLRRKGADLILSEKFYRVVVQAVLLFGSKTLVLTNRFCKNLRGPRAFLAAGDREEGSKSGGQYLAKGGGG